jgi:hypothetical protein
MIRTLTDQASRLLRRKLAYRRVFQTLTGEHSRDQEIVLADLRRFCRANASTAVISPTTKSIDPIAMAMAEGRREVWMRIAAMIHMQERTVFALEDVDSET